MCTSIEVSSVCSYIYCVFLGVVVVVGQLTTEGGVPPADRHAGALAGLDVGLHVVTQRGLHAIVLAHVVHAVAQEGLRGHQSVAAAEAVREDDGGAQGFELRLLRRRAIGVDVRALVRLAAAKQQREVRDVLKG